MPSSFDPISAAVADGKAFTAGAEVSVTGSQTASLQLENPSASTKLITILGFGVSVDTSSDLLVEFLLESTSTGAAQTFMPHLIGGGAPTQAVCKAGQGVLSGGTVQSPKIRVNNGSPSQYRILPHLLPPNHKIAIRVTGPGGIGTALVNMNVAFLET